LFISEDSNISLQEEFKTSNIIIHPDYVAKDCEGIRDAIEDINGISFVANLNTL
jgi:hypothetical protein